MNGTKYLVFERLHSDISQHLQMKKRQAEELTEREMLRILKKVAKGMAYLHQCSILHSDLAGRNVLVSYDLQDVKIAGTHGHAVLGPLQLSQPRRS